MSDLISRSESVEELEKYEKELQKDKVEAIETDDENMLFAITNQLTTICRIKRNIMNMPTAYSIDKVVEELESELEKGNIAIDFGEFRLFEIVKQGGVSDDVCKWTSTQINNEWKPSCEPNSTYNVFGVAWFRKCPYCGKKIKIVGD